jgi:hypothetical protein
MYYAGKGKSVQARNQERIKKRREEQVMRRRNLNIPQRVRQLKEPGYVDVATANYNLDTTGSIALLNTIPQGAGTSERVGKRVTLKSLQCRGVASNNSTATINDIAILIVYDSRPTGVLPAITDILVEANPTSFNNDANSGRFRILKRIDSVLMGSGANNYSARSAMNSDWYLDLKGKPQVFKTAATGAIGDIEEGALYVVTVGSSPPGTNAAVAPLSFRLRYIDV